MSARVRRERSALRCLLELGEPVVRLGGLGEVVLLLVAGERLRERGGGLLASAGGVQHLGEVEERVALPVQCVRALADRDGLAGRGDLLAGVNPSRVSRGSNVP